jgi:hypothetical protein
LNRDTGHYVTEAGETFEVRTSDNYLYLTGNASLPTSLLFFPTSRNQFTAVDTLNLRIVSLSFDQAHNVAIRSAGMDVKASRVRRAS